MSKYSGCNGHEDYDVLVKNDDGTAALYIDGNELCDENCRCEMDGENPDWVTAEWLNAVDPNGETDVNNVNVSVRHNGHEWVVSV